MMIRRFAPLLGLLLCGLGGCAGDAVQPTPTSDQVIAAQLRARGGQGAMSGPEAAAIADAYRQEIAKPSRNSQPPLSDMPGSGINT
jgi:hypothetical protein